jgi:hypothetical protein
MEKSLVPEPGPIVRIKTFVAFSMFKKHHNFMLVKYRDLGRILGKEEKRRISGGLEDPNYGGTCQAWIQTEYGYTLMTNLSRQDAEGSATKAGEHWCCSSCCTATWADHTGCGTA